MTRAPDEQEDQHPRAALRHLRERAPRRPTVFGVLGEILITCGLIVLLFLGWQVWWNSLVLSGQQTNAAAQQSRQWTQNAPSTPEPTATTTPTGVSYGPPPVMDPVGAAKAFAVLYVPRFGPDYKRVIKETVDVESVLNSYTSGIGHYPDTQMPGAVGNFAIAGHDTGWGNALIDVAKLQIGDAIYIQTKDGYYTYRFRNFEYVQPSAVSVLLPVPRVADAAPQDRFITITTCNPPYHAAERLIAYGVFDSWQPLSVVPPEIAASVAAKG